MIPAYNWKQYSWFEYRNYLVRVYFLFFGQFLNEYIKESPDWIKETIVVDFIYDVYRRDIFMHKPRNQFYCFAGLCCFIVFLFVQLFRRCCCVKKIIIKRKKIVVDKDSK